MKRKAKQCCVVMSLPGNEMISEAMPKVLKNNEISADQKPSQNRKNEIASPSARNDISEENACNDKNGLRHSLKGAMSQDKIKTKSLHRGKGGKNGNLSDMQRRGCN